MTFLIDGSAVDEGAVLAPEVLDAKATILLDDLGVKFDVGRGGWTMTTGTLDIELHEWNFDDYPGEPDAFYGAGSSLTIHYIPIPAPGALAMLSLTGLVGRRHRR